MSLYLNYDRAALDAQYFLRGRHKDFQQHLDRYESESARTVAALGCRRNVPYGPSPEETLDVFPARTPGSPVQVFIHGGYWQAQDKRSYSFVAGPLVAAGAAAVVINYALAPTVGLDEIVRQVRAAVAWTVLHAREFNGDPERIHVSGHSAGGHLTAMMLITDWAELGEQGRALPAVPVKSGYAISGLFDLEPVRMCYLNEVLNMDEATAHRNSPLHHLPVRGVPLMALVGGAETDEFIRQNVTFAAAWRAKGFPTQEVVAPELNHFTILHALAEADHPLTRAMLTMMGL